MMDTIKLLKEAEADPKQEKIELMKACVILKRKD